MTFLFEEMAVPNSCSTFNGSALTLAQGNAAQRPNVNADMRYNSATGDFEGYATAPVLLGKVSDLDKNTRIELNSDEFYFYGNLETDISATIYEMKYLINLGNNQFTATSNPTLPQGADPFITEIGLYNSNKDLMVISKLQSPVKRQGIQQFVVKLDF